jgi:hypothetical protein
VHYDLSAGRLLYSAAASDVVRMGVGDYDIFQLQWRQVLDIFDPDSGGFPVRKSRIY